MTAWLGRTGDEGLGRQAHVAGGGLAEACPQLELGAESLVGTAARSTPGGSSRSAPSEGPV